MPLRATVVADADELGALFALVRPYIVLPPGATQRGLERAATDERVRGWVYEQDGVIVGWGRVTPADFRTQADAYQGMLIVHPDHLGQGIGRALADLMQEHLHAHGAKRLDVLTEGPGGLAFAVARGGVPGEAARVASVRLDELPAAPDVPAEVTVRRLSELEPQDVHPVYAETVLQIPGFEEGYDVSYDAFLANAWDPARGNQLELGAAAVVAGKVVGVSLVHRADDRLWTNLTATSASYRGRGLAKILKWSSLSWAAEAGCRVGFTQNSPRNAPMLAVNEWLGYREAATGTAVTWSVESDL
ncbi:GNAT family N-acetyltransferase [Kribbella sp. NPDC056345]|uniref:GNAT family N-acetyltransferase n=1 Tax=Kribbella sp. NPDC056345 TaxID=3345789 RepID=UPI0035D89022